MERKLKSGYYIFSSAFCKLTKEPIRYETEEEAQIAYNEIGNPYNQIIFVPQSGE